jgi:hypothetical protein
LQFWYFGGVLGIFILLFLNKDPFCILINSACTFCFMLRDDHPESVLSSMQNIMGVLLEESEDVPENLLSSLLSTLGREKRVSTFAFTFILSYYWEMAYALGR